MEGVWVRQLRDGWRGAGSDDGGGLGQMMDGGGLGQAIEGWMEGGFGQTTEGWMEGGVR